MSAKKCLLVGENRLLFEGLKHILSGCFFDVVDVVEFEALKDGQVRQPDVVILDATMPDADVLDKVASFVALYPDTPIVVLADTFDDGMLAGSLRAGAAGLLLKSVSSAALVQSLKLVLLGEKVFPTRLASYLLQSQSLPRTLRTPPRMASKGLSPRENEILQCLVWGDSNKEIANRLGITEGTVKVHVKRLLRKIKAANRTQAAIWGISNGFPADRSGADRAEHTPPRQSATAEAHSEQVCL